ncbi:unnamed protein product, partial [Choristocarpus tenellus]
MVDTTGEVGESKESGEHMMDEGNVENAQALDQAPSQFLGGDIVAGSVPGTVAGETKPPLVGKRSREENDEADVQVDQTKPVTCIEQDRPRKHQRPVSGQSTGSSEDPILDEAALPDTGSPSNQVNATSTGLRSPSDVVGSIMKDNEHTEPAESRKQGAENVSITTHSDPEPPKRRSKGRPRKNQSISTPFGHVSRVAVIQGQGWEKSQQSSSSRAIKTVLDEHVHLTEGQEMDSTAAEEPCKDREGARKRPLEKTGEEEKQGEGALQTFLNPPTQEGIVSGNHVREEETPVEAEVTGWLSPLVHLADTSDDMASNPSRTEKRSSNGWDNGAWKPGRKENLSKPAEGGLSMGEKHRRQKGGSKGNGNVKINGSSKCWGWESPSLTINKKGDGREGMISEEQEPPVTGGDEGTSSRVLSSDQLGTELCSSGVSGGVEEGDNMGAGEGGQSKLGKGKGKGKGKVSRLLLLERSSASAKTSSGRMAEADSSADEVSDGGGFEEEEDKKGDSEWEGSGESNEKDHESEENRDEDSNEASGKRTMKK